MNGHLYRAAFLDALTEWLNRTLVPPGVTVGADTALFGDRLIDSIRILELIAWTEQATGMVIEDEMIRMDRFATPRTIAENFANGKHHVGS